MSQTNETTDTERITKLKEAISSIDSLLEIDEKKRQHMYKLKGALIQTTRALNPVFWLDGKKSFELLQLYKEEMKLRVSAGFNEIYDGPMTVNKRQLIIRDWKFIEKRKWEKNRVAILSGKKEMIV